LPHSIKEIKRDLLKVPSKPIFTTEEIHLVEKIKMKTDDLNRDNITRTKAYLEFYQKFPDIHWAFLAHMVSRNGGWNMTDLKGDLLSDLLDKQTKLDFFSFLERANWLIFQDAFPQLLLYEESVKRNQGLFYLLPMFNISYFMEVIWNNYWKQKDAYLLTSALITNEQNYIEQRIMNKKEYQEKVLETFEFKLQELLSLNHILFPYEAKGEKGLVGLTINQFSSLEERILFGKRLYSLLFDEKILPTVKAWAVNQPHSGSRKDYWPTLFNDIKEYAPGSPNKKRLYQCKLSKGVARFYSPRLEFAWKDVLHELAEAEDWYKDWKIVRYLLKEDEIVNGKITDEYCETLESLELASLAKKNGLRIAGG
jgi:hypothetical protein